MSASPRSSAPARAPTIIDVAKLARVSKSTVSNVLQGTVYVEERTRERVLAAIAELAYRPNAGARYLRQRSRVLGVVVGDLRNPFHAEMAAQIEQYAAERQHSILLATTGGLPERETERVRMLIDHRVAAVVFVAFSGHAAVLRTIPGDVARIFVSFSSRGGTSIAVDDAHGAKLAVEHLIDLGHSRIAYVSNSLEDDPKTDRSRFDGYRHVMEAHSLQISTRHIVRHFEHDKRHPSARERLAALLAGARRPTAIFAASDYTALQILDAAASAGLRVPADLSVVGFDDIEIAGLSRVRLTTVAQPVDEMAQRVVTTAIDTPRNGSSRSPKGRRLAPTLVVRDSTGPPPHP